MRRANWPMPCKISSRESITASTSSAIVPSAPLTKTGKRSAASARFNVAVSSKPSHCDNTKAGYCWSSCVSMSFSPSRVIPACPAGNTTTTWSVDKATLSCAHCTTSACATPLETGTCRVKRLPANGMLPMSRRPFSAAMRSLTTSIPTPRPETSVTRSRVLKPGRKIMRSSSDSVRFVPCETRPKATAFSAMRAKSKPRPSSLTTISTS